MQRVEVGRPTQESGRGDLGLYIVAVRGPAGRYPKSNDLDHGGHLLDTHKVIEATSIDCCNFCYGLCEYRLHLL